MTNTTTAAQLPFEKVTIYLTPEQQIILDEVKLKLRRQSIKASKSNLVRVAVQLLEAHPLEQIIARLKLDQK